MRRNLRRDKALLGLKKLEYRFRRIGGYKDWNVKVNSVFSSTQTYSFEDLVGKDISTAEYLVSRFKG